MQTTFFYQDIEQKHLKQLNTKKKSTVLECTEKNSQRETVARKLCNLTLNLHSIQKCTFMRKQAHADKIQGFCPNPRGTFGQKKKKNTLWDFSHFVFGVLDFICVLFSSFSLNSYTTSRQGLNN